MLLADENVPAKTIDALRARGIEVLSIRERSPGLSDELVLALAVAERRAIVSFDRDYGELVFKRNHACPPGIIYLRTVPQSPEELANVIVWLLNGGAGPIQGKMVIVTPRGVRARLFPTRH